MPSRPGYQSLFGVLSEDAEYRTDMERRFFEAIKNPPEPSERFKEMVRRFGPFAFRDDRC
jgi:hypothetical protein